METVNLSEFKVRCLAILDRVQTTRQSVVILKRGRPVAELVPVSNAVTEYPQSKLHDTVTFVGDVIGPVFPEEA